MSPSTGSALAHRFHAGGYRVAMLACNGERLRALEQSPAGAIGDTCNVADGAELAKAFAKVGPFEWRSNAAAIDQDA